jgi:hypothetical protein
MKIDEKKCSKCDETKSLNDFFNDKQKKDGKTSACKKCLNKIKAKYRQKNRELCLSYYRNYHQKNKTEIIKRHKKYRQKNKRKIHKQQVEYNKRKRNTEEGRKQYNAYQKLHYHLRVGDIKRMPCVKCGNPNSEAHHPNGYDRENALNIKWLCHKCHTEEHYAIR